MQAICRIGLKTDHDQFKASASSRLPCLIRGCFEPAVQTRTDHLNLERQRLALQPDAALEPNHPMPADKVRKQLFQLPTGHGAFTANLTAEGLHMRMVVVIMPITITVIVACLLYTSDAADDP